MEQNAKKRAAKAAGFFSALAAAFLFVIFVWKPACFFTSLTGLACPGCGGQRMLWAVFRGDLSGAFRQNPLLFCLLPLLLAYAVWETVRYIRGKPPLWKTRAFAVILAAVVLIALLFGVLRNLPGFEFLGPF